MNMLFLFTPESGYQDDRAPQCPESVYQHNKTKKIRRSKPLTNLTPPSQTPVPSTSFWHSSPTFPFSYSLASRARRGLISAFFSASLGFNRSQTCFVSSLFLAQQCCNYPPTQVLRKTQLQSQDYNCLGLYFQRVLG